MSIGYIIISQISDHSNLNRDHISSIAFHSTKDSARLNAMDYIQKLRDKIIETFPEVNYTEIEENKDGFIFTTSDSVEEYIVFIEQVVCV